MAQDVTVAGASYTGVPAVTLPKSGGGTATFYDQDSLADVFAAKDHTHTAADVGALPSSTVIPTITKTTATLAASGWNSTTKTQSVTVTGVTASNTVILTPDAASIAAWADGGVRCTAQASNSLTFTADQNPAANITVNVVIV